MSSAVQDLRASGRAFTIRAEAAGDARAREQLLDKAMGPGRFRKSSEKLRAGRQPAYSLVALNAAGALVGTVRLWHVRVSGRDVLLLGPLAVDEAHRKDGVGGALMRAAIEEAKAAGHSAILLVGDPAYYQRFGFSAELTGQLCMPGPYELHRFQALELQPGALAGAKGVLVATGLRTQRRARRGAPQPWAA
jgi:predicted N-acetyltransferase YhbS